MTSVGLFGVTIVGGKLYKGSYYKLPSGAEYSINLTNYSGERADAVVAIDGKQVGTFRVDAYSTVSIERPVNEKKKFVFITQNNDVDGLLSDVPYDKLGLVQVKFLPERKIYANRDTILKPLGWTGVKGNSARSFNPNVSCDHYSCSCNAGGTVLGDKSNQSFETVAPLKYDEENSVQINVRLIADIEPKYQKLSTCKSNPVPPPL